MQTFLGITNFFGPMNDSGNVSLSFFTITISWNPQWLLTHKLLHPRTHNAFFISSEF